MKIKDIISKNYSEFKSLFQDHHVSYLYAFGSSTDDRFDHEKSDFDFLVEIDVSDPIEKGEKLLLLWDTFEKLFNRRVDLLTENSIRNPCLRKNIDATQILIYDRNGSEISN